MKVIETADLKMFDKAALPDGWYIGEFDFTGSPGNVERIVFEVCDGLCYTTGDAAYEDGPSPVAETSYRIVKKLDLWAR
jgi:hypothetical protein